MALFSRPIRSEDFENEGPSGHGSTTRVRMCGVWLLRSPETIDKAPAQGPGVGGLRIERPPGGLSFLSRASRQIEKGVGHAPCESALVREGTPGILAKDLSLASVTSGGGGIRTPGDVAATTDFKSAAFDRSATPPWGGSMGENERGCHVGVGGGRHSGLAAGGGPDRMARFSGNL